MSTEPMPLLDVGDIKPGGRRRVVFDPTINLGHLLTFVGFLATGFTAYQTLDRRQTVQETKSIMAEERSREQELRFKEALIELRSEVKEMRRSVDEMSRSMNRQSGPRDRQ